MLAFLDYWDARRGDRAVPDRADIDPVEIPPRLLPHLLLGEISEPGARLRYRVVGTELVRRFGREPTGRYADEVLGKSQYAYFTSLIRDLCIERCPVYSEARFDWDAGGHVVTSRLLVPLTRGGEETAMVMGAYELGRAVGAEPTALLSDTGEMTETRRLLIRR
jgi:hypothetical protein